ncbi:sugar transferase [Virgibacillus litoralis]|uniref:Sugar transferase EpsL n=1 Tax=Virgibacillus litoralis TaxID=578221 RepID=A0ABS4HDR7_9BACI|nr:sugar transferase [Virgibacillus litoralis]MBP1949061.1 sugar transferase EpsL [Virgibacillus litoralis]
MKRLLDSVMSIMIVTLFSPLIIVLAVVIRIRMGKPILFKQKRPGLNGKPFYLYKFRTMTNVFYHNSKQLSDDVRLTPLGKFLRKYSLDEFPQLFNVLKGDMSLVGPRPLLMEYLPLYTKEQSLRHTVKPGITGWAQINGRNAITWEEKFRLDAWYVENRSLFLDCRILLKTFLKVLKHEGISGQDTVTMEKFNGTKEVL